MCSAYVLSDANSGRNASIFLEIGKRPVDINIDGALLFPVFAASMRRQSVSLIQKPLKRRKFTLVIDENIGQFLAVDGEVRANPTLTVIP